MDFLRKISKRIGDRWENYSTGGVTKLCPRCSHNNIVSYPKTVCRECEYEYPIESLSTPIFYDYARGCRINSKGSDVNKGDYTSVSDALLFLVSGNLEKKRLYEKMTAKVE
jgi:hypothetical protein